MLHRGFREGGDVMSLKENVSAKFADITQLPRDRIQLDSDLFDVYNLDSVKALKLISDIEV